VAWSDDDYITSFDTEAGDISTLATSDQKILWFNEAQERLLRRRQDFTDIVWSAGNRSVDLPADFVSLAHIIFDTDSSIEVWRVWGQTFILTDPSGASGDGSARVFYYAEYAPMTTLTTATELSKAQDYACLYYALHRFYKKLSSNRAYYKRYATLVGQNAVSMTDLQQESDRYYQDFLDSREDLEPEAPAFFYGE
jgi:hypothetical protein